MSDPSSTKPAPMADVRTRFNEMSVLAPLLGLYTAAYLGLMIADFALREAYDAPPGLMPVYIALLGAYAADKEIRRWLHRVEPPRKGSLFVYLWLLFFLAAFLIHAIVPSFSMPDEWGKVALQVLGIFFGTKASKTIYEWRRESSDEKRGEWRARVVEVLRADGPLARSEIARRLAVSDATAKRLLAAMVAEGLIRSEGQGKGTVYRGAG